jgi:SAM-dependent methyltransferase
MDAAFWNSRYAGDTYFYGHEPNDFLKERAALFAKGDDTLCLADGEGRNGVFLATLGARVTAVDLSPVALEKAKRLAGERGVDLETEVVDLAVWDLGVDRWDAVVSIWAHLPPAVRSVLHPKIARAVRPGGILFVEHYHPQQIPYKTGGPPDPAWMLTLDELSRDFPDWERIHVFEGERDVREGSGHGGLSYVTQAILRRPGHGSR